MFRRSASTCLAVVSLTLLLQGVVAVSGSIAVANASPHRATTCRLSRELMGLHGTDRACRWTQIAARADHEVAHLACTITGTSGDDVLKGTKDKDVICGLQGDDLVKARGGRDVVYGGAGKDRIRGGPGRDELLGEEGNDRLMGGAASDDLFGQQGNDALIGAGWMDYLAGGYGNDFLSSGPGNDFVNDTRGSDVAQLGTGRDTFESLHGLDVVNAGPGNDYCLTLADGQPGDLIDGGPGRRDRFDADPGDIWTSAEIGPQPCNGC